MSRSEQFSVRIDRIEADAAADLWNAAPLSTVFTHPKVLAAMCARVEWWVSYVGNVAVCAWPVCLDAAGSPVLPGFAYYVGPFWVGAPEPSPRRRLLLEVAVYEALLAALQECYGALQFALPPGFTDLRPLLWFEYAREAVVARPRYTACIDDLGQHSAQSLLELFSTERGADARRAQRRGARLLPSCEFAQFDQLYQNLMSDRGATDTYAQRQAELQALWTVVEQGFGYVVACAEAHSDALQAAWLVLVGKGRACGVVAAATPQWRERKHNAWSCWQALLAAQRFGANIYDFNGANSPQRGNDKHSFGAEAALYFDLKLRSAVAICSHT